MITEEQLDKLATKNDRWLFLATLVLLLLFVGFVIFKMLEQRDKDRAAFHDLQTQFIEHLKKSGNAFP